MRKKYEEFLEIPEGIEVSINGNQVEGKKGDKVLNRVVDLPGTKLESKDGKVKFVCLKANKVDIKRIKSVVAHLKNMFSGLDEDFSYKLEICHVHFPMTVKVDGDKIKIDNFLGEKTGREAKIVPGVKVDVKGKDVIVSGADIEDVGQTAANIEKAATVPNKDRRIFQDGIFIVEKGGRI